MKKLLIILLICVSLYSGAQTSYTWDGSTDTDWNTASNWTPAAVPGSGDNIILNTGSGNQPVMDGSHSITNITVSAGTLDLNSFTLTITGTTSLTGGAINNGTLTFNNTTTTIAGMTIGATLNITANTINLGTSTFSSPVTVIKGGSSSDIWNGGNTFSSTLDFYSTTGSTNFTHTAANTFNDDILLANTGSGIINFASSSGTSTLASGKTIGIGTNGFSAGTLDIKGLTQSGSTAQTITLTGTSKLRITSSTFNGALTATAPALEIQTSDFYGSFLCLKNGSSSDIWNGNTFHSTFDFYSTNGTTNFTYTANTVYNDNVTVANSGSGIITFSGSTGTSTLASGKTISIGTNGFSAGTLDIRNLTQAGSTAQTLTLTGTATLKLTSAIFNGALTATAPLSNFATSTFNGAVIVNKSSSSAATWNGGNTFNSTLEINVSSGNLDLTFSTTSNYNDNVTISNTGSGALKLATTSGISNLATAKTLTIGSGGFAAGSLTVNGLVQAGSTAQTLSLSGTATLNIISSTFNGALTATAPLSNFATSTFNGAVIVNKSSSSAAAWNGGNTFNSTLEINVSSGNLDLTFSTTSNYNDNVTISNTGSGAVRLATTSGVSNLATAKTLTIGSGGFAAGSLTVNGLVQAGSTAQTLSLSGTATLNIISSTFNGALTATAPLSNFATTTFNGAVIVNKSSSSAATWNGANTFNSTLEINVSSGGLDMGFTSGNTFNGNVEFNNTGSGTIRLATTITATNTLASGKTIGIGSTGFATGNLVLGGLVQSGSTAQNITLTGSSTTLTIAGNTTFNGAITISAPNVLIENSMFNAALTVTKSSSSTNTWYAANTYNGNVSITNTGTGYINLSYVASGGDVYNANATFTKSSSGDVLVAGNASTVTFKGDVTFSGVSSTQFTGSQSMVFTGTALQTLTSSTTLSFGNITINKASNNLTLNSALNIASALTLTSGKIITTSTYLLNFNDNATVSGASNSSHIQGPVSKTGNDAFTFPTGKGGVYRPIDIAAPASSASIFTAEYINANQTLGSTLQSPITTISNCEHWTLTRSGSSSNVAVTLNWGSGSCNTANPSIMRVASWSGSQWDDGGNASNTGSNTAGSVTSGTISTFNAFTLGNTCTLSASITSTPTSTSHVCPGVSVTLTATSSSSYLWSTSATTQNISPTISDTYSVTITDSDNCKATASRVVTFSTLTASITSTPTSTANVCPGVSVTLTGNTADSYLWSPGGATTQAINPTTDNTYTLTTYDAMGCSTSVNRVVAFSTITAAITPSQTPTTNVCIADNLGLTSNTASSYSWSPGSATTQTIYPTASGTYTLTTSDGNGCTATDDIEVSLIFPPDQPTVPNGPAIRCEGIGTDEYEVDFDAGVNSYTWSIDPPDAIINNTDADPDNDLIDYTTNSIVLTWNPTFSGTATLTISATNSCPTDPTNEVEITVSPLETYYADFDGDGLANPMVYTQTCPVPDGYILPNSGFDCDDNVFNP